MCDPQDIRNNVDLFAQSPMDFDQMWQRSTLVRLGDVDIHVAAIQDLIEMKRRPADPSIATTSNSFRSWRICGVTDDAKRWPDARDDLALVVATTTPLQRLEWLEQMIDLAYETGALQKALGLERLERSSS